MPVTYGISWHSTLCLLVIPSCLLLLVLNYGIFRVGSPPPPRNVPLLLCSRLGDWHRHLHQKLGHCLSLPIACSSTLSQHPPSQSHNSFDQLHLVNMSLRFPFPNTDSFSTKLLWLEPPIALSWLLLHS